MNVQISIVVIALAVASLALAPSPIINQSADAKPWCETQGKSSNWVFGCKNGWWDHDHCQDYRPESGDYAKGYKVGWDKGSCK